MNSKGVEFFTYGTEKFGHKKSNSKKYVLLENKDWVRSLTGVARVALERLHFVTASS